MEDIDFALKYIDKKSATIFKLHYGLIDGKFYTAKEITKKINDAEGGTNAVSDTTIKGCIRTVTARIQELIKLKKQNPINNSIYPFYLNLLSLVPTDKLDIALEKLSSFPSIARLYIELECGLIDGKTFTRYEAAKLLGIPHCKIVSNTIEVKQKLLQVINDESIEDISFSFIDKKNSKGEPEDIFYLEIPLAQKLRVVESFTDKISVAMKLYFTTWGSFRSRVEKVDEQLQIGYRATACRICRGKALFQEFVNNGERPTIKTKEQRIEENFGAKIEVIEAFIPYLDLDEQDVFTSVHGFGELEPTRLSLVAKNHHWSLTKTQGILINAEKIIRTGLAMMKANIFNKGDTKVELRDTSQRKDNTSKPNLPLKEKAQEDSNDASDANKKMEVLNKIFMHPYMNQERIVTSVITRQSYLTTERREMTSLVKVWTKESDHKSLLYECLDGPAELSIDQIIRKNHFPEAIAVNIIMSFLEFVNPNILEVLGLSEESFVLTHNYPLEESKPTC